MTSTRVPAAAVLIAAVLAALAASILLADRRPVPPSMNRVVATPIPTPTPTPTPVPTATPTATPAATATPPVVVAPATPRIDEVQRRLLALGYWLPAATGELDEGTRHAITALQKVAGLPRTGEPDAATLDALERGVLPAPVPQGVVEIDRARQVLVVGVDAAADAIFDTSTGKPSTPTVGGTFRVYKQIDGLRVSRLGRLWRPKYFYRGQAIHGFTSVPPYAASHGCVRVTYAAMDHIWAGGLIEVGTTVIVR